MLDLKRKFEFDPDSAQRIADVIEKHPMSLKHCADILEAVAPLCTALTTGGFLRRMGAIESDLLGGKDNESRVIRPGNMDCAVKCGSWINKGWDGDFSWRIDGRGNCWEVIECSECGEKSCGGPLTAYCPHCGAKMDLTNEA